MLLILASFAYIIGLKKITTCERLLVPSNPISTYILTHLEQIYHNCHSSTPLSKNWYHILYEQMHVQLLPYPIFWSNLHHKDYHHTSMTIISFPHSYLSYCTPTTYPLENCYYLLLGVSQASSRLSSQGLKAADRSPKMIILEGYHLSTHSLFWFYSHIFLVARSKAMNEHS